MNLTLQERETTLLFNEQEESAELFTYNRKLIRRLSQLTRERPGECRQTKDNCRGGVAFVFPKSWVRVNPPRIAAVLDDAALERRREQLRTIHSARKKLTTPPSGTAEPALPHT